MVVENKMVSDRNYIPSYFRSVRALLLLSLLKELLLNIYVLLLSSHYYFRWNILEAIPLELEHGNLVSVHEQGVTIILWDVYEIAMVGTKINADKFVNLQMEI